MPVEPPIPYQNRTVMGVFAAGTFYLIGLYLWHTPEINLRIPLAMVITGAVAWLMSVICQHLTQQILVYLMCAGIVWYGGDLIRSGVEVTPTGVGFTLLLLPFATAVILSIFRAVPAGTYQNDTLNPEFREDVMRGGGE